IANRTAKITNFNIKLQRKRRLFWLSVKAINTHLQHVNFNRLSISWKAGAKVRDLPIQGKYIRKFFFIKI
ncbi:hypothetical protein, partial [Bacteroides fragilis]|uniref:hypothetical protein n=1 Tax=Bacteroides fragilis TaxID=817 RepID=UPI0020308745